jgi:hypothetical protein
MASDIDHRRLEFLRYAQSGVLARRQLLEVGLSSSDIDRLVRRREWRVAHPGVLVDHTGPLTWAQREWVAVLAMWPAALCHESAIPGVPTREIHVAIGLHRTLRPLPGTRLHPTAHLEERVDWRASPPRIRTDHAIVDLMSRRIKCSDVAGAYAALAQACFSATTPDRVERALGRRARVAGRPLISGMLSDLRTGACSVLERGYLHRVERPHGLPRARRQRPSLASGERTDQDVRYEEYGVIVELDGRAIHDRPESWDADAARDLAELATAAAVTARVTYGLVFGRQCATAGWIGQILQRQGWRGEPVRCPSCPPDCS